MTLTVPQNAIDGLNLPRLLAAAITTVLHLALVFALLFQPPHGGPMRRQSGLDSGKLVVVSLMPIQPLHNNTDPAMPTTPPSAAPLHIAKRQPAGAATKHVPSFTDGENGDSSSAVALQPDATTTMTDIAVLEYRARLAAHLSQFRRYPMEARRNQREGTVYLHFILAANGRVLNAWVSQSSGTDALDDEALDAIIRAQPLPAIPLGWPAQLDVTMPFTFVLN